jgi:hypothetical protein
VGAREGVEEKRRRLWVSRSPGKVVARYADGRVLKGYADFDPDQPTFRLMPAETPAGEGIEVPLAALKAVFIVRSFAGEPGYSESKDLYQARPRGARKICVEFADGEELVGHTRDDLSKRVGFFFTPLDPRSNNLKVFAVVDAVSRVRRLL